MPKNKLNTPLKKKAQKPKLKKTYRCLYPECKEFSKNRGLCKKHHSKYSRKRKALPSNQQLVLDKDLIRRGLLLPEPKAIEKDPFEIGSKVKGNLKKRS